ncbi:MAG: MATE family efflux transporter [Treponema sp.]|jgi:putative MATE family efflux protein|nr:MATE family efflux transporter [Treponema sp.]
MDWNNRAVLRLLWPLIIEQLLLVTMGIADTMMVSSVGEYAVSGVSIVDAINVLLVTAFGALATGGAVVTSQYIGRRDYRSSCRAARQLVYAALAISLATMVLTIAFRNQVLGLIYGHIDRDVMHAARTYFLITAFSYPFLAMYNAGAALFRSMGNSRITMWVSLVVNIINIVGNALFIFVFKIGVAGVAISTLLSRIVAAWILMGMLLSRKKALPLNLFGLLNFRLEPVMIRNILNIGIPSGIEASMFQLGKLCTSRLVTTFGTYAIAANAVCGVINSAAFMPANAFGLAMITIVGQYVGAENYAEAKRKVVVLMKMVYTLIFTTSIVTYIFREPLLRLFNLSLEAHALSLQYLWILCVINPVVWPLSFGLPNALRAAGDARYCLVVGASSMWILRISCAFFLALVLKMGPMGIYWAMVADWFVRAFFFGWRWFGGRWQAKRVIRD